MPRLTKVFQSCLFALPPLPKVSTGGRPIYYVSSRRDVFTPMKLPKYTLPKVECLIHTCSTGTHNLPRRDGVNKRCYFRLRSSHPSTLAFEAPNLYKIRFSPDIRQAFQSERVNSGTQMLPGPLASRDVAYYSKLKFSCAHMTIKRFIQSSSPRSLKHAPGNPRSAWGR